MRPLGGRIARQLRSIVLFNHRSCAMITRNWRGGVFCAAAAIVSLAGVSTFGEEPTPPKAPRPPEQKARPNRERQRDSRRHNDQQARPGHRLIRLFMALDANGDGVVDKTEFRQRMPRILQRLHAAHRPQRDRHMGQPGVESRRQGRGPAPRKMEPWDRRDRRGPDVSAAPMMRRPGPPVAEGRGRNGEDRRGPRWMGDERAQKEKREGRGPQWRSKDGMDRMRGAPSDGRRDESRRRAPLPPREGPND